MCIVAALLKPLDICSDELMNEQMTRVSGI